MWLPKPKTETTVPTVRRHIDHNGIDRATGTSHLKETQAYPADFGRAVAAVMSNIFACEPRVGGVHLVDLASAVNTDDDWPDAELGVVLTDLLALARNVGQGVHV